MDPPTSHGRAKFRWVTGLALGYLIFLFTLLAVVILFVVLSHRPQLSVLVGIPTPLLAPAPTATSTPTPHILGHLPQDTTPIRLEDFPSNIRNWSLYDANGKVQVINGKLILQSYDSSGSVIAYDPAFIPPGHQYYVQADFLPDLNASQPFGLVFGFDDSLDTYYTFEIRLSSRQFGIFKHSDGKWNALVPFSSGEMKPYPEVNTLSAYVDGGRIEVYINGASAAAYTDPQPYPSTDVGVIKGDSSYRLIVDNFFAYSEK